MVRDSGRSGVWYRKIAGEKTNHERHRRRMVFAQQYVALKRMERFEKAAHGRLTSTSWPVSSSREGTVPMRVLPGPNSDHGHNKDSGCG